MTRSARVLVVLAALFAMMAGTGCNKLKARDQLNKGVQSYKSARYEEAIEQYTITIKLSPGNPIAYFNRANDLRKLCRNDEALRDYKKIMEIAPDMARTRKIPTSIDNNCSKT